MQRSNCGGAERSTTTAESPRGANTAVGVPFTVAMLRRYSGQAAKRRGAERQWCPNQSLLLTFSLLALPDCPIGTPETNLDSQLSHVAVRGSSNSNPLDKPLLRHLLATFASTNQSAECSGKLTRLAVECEQGALSARDDERKNLDAKRNRRGAVIPAAYGLLCTTRPSCDCDGDECR
jgi:hypothetical protein